ncbi:hypothetical protein A0H81_04580 [Grifola frondosa]|uniref:Uncharacterized protein n=1 Tax=Grifola frondosa TaxID=5627 RepID=A0A1C7MG32_GRIFR|nr:hypothetical protein A0H81_04580 [Grifola frondosa]
MAFSTTTKSSSARQFNPAGLGPKSLSMPASSKAREEKFCGYEADSESTTVRKNRKRASTGSRRKVCSIIPLSLKARTYTHVTEKATTGLGLGLPSNFTERSTVRKAGASYPANASPSASRQSTRATVGLGLGLPSDFTQRSTVRRAGASHSASPAVSRQNTRPPIGLGLPSYLFDRPTRRRIGASYPNSPEDENPPAAFGLGLPTTVVHRPTHRRAGSSYPISPVDEDLPSNIGLGLPSGLVGPPSHRRAGASYPRLPAPATVGLGLGLDTEFTMPCHSRTTPRTPELPFAMYAIHVTDPDDALITYSFRPPGLSTPIPTTAYALSRATSRMSRGASRMPGAPLLPSASFEPYTGTPCMSRTQTMMPTAPRLPTISQFGPDPLYYD